MVTVVGASLADGYENQSMTESHPGDPELFPVARRPAGWLTSYVTAVGLIACLWYAIGLALTLRRYERGVPWRSAFLAAAGVVGVVSGQIASWDAAVFRSATIDPHVATYAYDLGNISFANSWVATGAVGICAGLVMLRAPGTAAVGGLVGTDRGRRRGAGPGLVPGRLRLRALRRVLDLGADGVGPPARRTVQHITH